MPRYIDTPNQDLMERAPDCFEPRSDALEIGGIAWLRVFSACQALMCPTNFYRVTHKRAREVIKEILGFCPKGKPGTPRVGSKFRDGGKKAIYDWLGIEALVHDRHESMCVSANETTYILFHEGRR